MATRSSTVKRIVIGVDGSDAGKHALEWTARLAKSMAAEVVAVYALDIPVALPDPYTMPLYLDDNVRRGIESDFVNKWCSPLKTAGVRYRAILQDGRPASVIMDVADKEVAELLLGSVSHEVVLHSKHPVLLVPRKA